MKFQPDIAPQDILTGEEIALLLSPTNKSLTIEALAENIEDSTANRQLEIISRFFARRCGLWSEPKFAGHQVDLSADGQLFEIIKNDGNCFLFFDRQAILVLINNMLGAKNTPDREALITPTLQKMMLSIVADLSRGLYPTTHLECQISRLSALPSTWTAKTIQIFEQGTMTLFIPPPNTQNQRHFSADMPIELTALICQQKITLQEVLQWKIGKILPLAIENNNEISILWGNKAIFKAVLGKKNDHIAAQITGKALLK